MKRQTDFIDALLGDSVDVETWEEESQAKLATANQRTIRDFWMREGDMPKLITFLNEGVQLHLHSIWAGKGTPVEYILCKPAGHHCEICASGKQTNRQVVYAVIDWFYWDTDGNKVDRPEVKLMIRGKDDFKKFEQRRQNKNQGDGTLLGRYWEITRIRNSYDILADDLVTIDWAEMIDYTKKDGSVIEIPRIRSYDWPEYIHGEETIWSKANVRDTYPVMDWSNPKLVDRWILAHFSNRPDRDYRRLAGVKEAGHKKTGYVTPPIKNMEQSVSQMETQPVSRPSQRLLFTPQRQTTPPTPQWRAQNSNSAVDGDDDIPF